MLLVDPRRSLQRNFNSFSGLVPWEEAWQLRAARDLPSSCAERWEEPGKVFLRVLLPQQHICFGKTSKMLLYEKAQEHLMCRAACRRNRRFGRFLYRLCLLLIDVAGGSQAVAAAELQLLLGLVPREEVWQLCAARVLPSSCAER